jgi:hypothetical protein
MTIVTNVACGSMPSIWAHCCGSYVALVHVQDIVNEGKAPEMACFQTLLKGLFPVPTVAGSAANVIASKEVPSFALDTALTAKRDAPSYLRRYGLSLKSPPSDYGLRPLRAFRDVSVTESLVPRGTRLAVPGGFSFAWIRPRASTGLIQASARRRHGTDQRGLLSLFRAAPP